MGIKVGNKVRVSKDIPQFYRKYNSMGMFEQTFRVVDIEDGLALLKSTSIFMYTVALPTKYLIKVDAEAEEPKFKIGDWVKIGETPNPQLNGRAGAISQIDKKDYKISFSDGFFTVVSEEDLTLADEPTEAEKNAKEELQEEFVRFMENSISGKIYTQSDFLKDFDPMEHKINPQSPTYEVVVDNATINWPRYEADLAKELAVQMVKCNRNNYDKIGNMAVRVAKSVVENLKRN